MRTQKIERKRGKKKKKTNCSANCKRVFNSCANGNGSILERKRFPAGARCLRGAARSRRGAAGWADPAPPSCSGAGGICKKP